MNIRCKRAIYLGAILLLGFLYGAIFDDESRYFKEIYCAKVLK